MRPKGASAVWTVIITVVLLALVIWFFAWVFIYYRRISAGDLRDLPQFAAQASLTGQGIGGGGQGPGADLATDDDPSLGPKDAKLTVVEFLDYECPFCRAVSGTVRSLAAEYGDRVRFVIRDIPLLDIHPNALIAAEAVGCAEAQGKFWSMHDRVYAEQDKGVDRARLEAWAEQSGVSMPAFKTCMDTHARQAEIEEDLNAGVAAGVRGTPTFFFNGRRVEGVIPEAVFEQLILAFLAQ